MDNDTKLIFETYRLITEYTLTESPFEVAIGIYTETGDVKMIWMPVASVKEAREKIKISIDEIFKAGGNSSDWAGGELKKNGIIVAVFSRNGRLWSIGGKNPEGLNIPSNQELDDNLNPI